MEEKDALVLGRTNAQRKEDAAKRKEIFLAAYGEWGTIRKACEIAGISRDGYGNWHKGDPEFVKKLDLMRQSFAESLEQLALERVQNPDKNRGSDVLLLGLLNANWPAKYRPQFAMNEDNAKDLILEWRKAATKDVKEEVVGEPSPAGGEPLPAGVEETLTELLEKRRNAPVKDEEEENG